MRKETNENGTLETWDVDEVAQAIADCEIVVIDVRTPQEYMLEHIPGALLMPIAFFDATSLPTQDGKRLVFHCAGGGRSEKAARLALAAGLTPVAHLGGGFGAWKKAEKPYTATDKASGGFRKVNG